MAQSHSHIHANTPCSPQDVDAFLNEAETLVMRRGQRMTRIRRKVLRLLLESTAPAKAYDLLANLDGEGSAKPPTIYRALDFLQETGLAHNHSAVFLICDTCHGAEELHATATNEALDAETTAAGFQMSRAVVEVRGKCRDCAA